MVTLQASVTTTILPQAITRTLISSGMQAPATTTITIATQPASDPRVAYIYSMPVGMAGSGSGSSVATPARNTNTVQALGSISLNSIPFNPSAYVAALSGDQKRLLALEVATMGKSWCVARAFTRT